MGRLRIDYADVVARAQAEIEPRAVGAAIERLSAAWREGRDDFAWTDATHRAAYLWHIVPAHVCDAGRLFATQIDLLDRETLHVVALGAGPGSEVLGLMEAITSAKAADALPALREVRFTRVDRVGRWEPEFRALWTTAQASWALRCPGLGTTWTATADAPLIAADLLAAPDPALVDVLATAHVVTAFNLVSELPPRSEPALPAGARQGLAVLLRTALDAGATVYVVDRAGAPHVPPRFEALLAGWQEDGLALEVTGPRTRQSRCSCAFSRRARRLYRHVRLPTTNAEDGPVRNCRTLWMSARRGTTPA